MNLEFLGGRRGVPLENEKLKDLQKMARGIYHLSPEQILGKTKTELINAIRKKKNIKVKVRKDEYDGLTIKKLKEILKKRKIKGYSKLNKKGLLKLIRGEKSESFVSIEIIKPKSLKFTSGENINEVYYQQGDELDGIKHKYIVDKTLGMGGFGVAYLILEKDTNLPYVLKTADLSELNHEIAILKKINKLVDVINKPIKGLVYHYEEGNTIRYLAPLSEALCIDMYHQIKKQLDFIHSRNVYHRDISPNNIVFNENLENPIFELIDFGLSVDLDKEDLNKVEIQVGTRAYEYPPLYTLEKLNKEILKKADFWSLGCCLYFAYTGQRIYSGNKISRFFKVENLSSFENYAPDLWKIIIKLLKL